MLFIHSFIHSLNKYVLSPYYVPGNVLGCQDTSKENRYCSLPSRSSQPMWEKAHKQGAIQIDIQLFTVKARL